MERAMVPTGLYIELPVGFEAQIRPRSGLAIKHGLSIPNSPGTIDADYRGEIKILLINLGQPQQLLMLQSKIPIFISATATLIHVSHYILTKRAAPLLKKRRIL